MHLAETAQEQAHKAVNYHRKEAELLRQQFDAKQAAVQAKIHQTERDLQEARQATTGLAAHHQAQTAEAQRLERNRRDQAAAQAAAQEKTRRTAEAVAWTHWCNARKDEIAKVQALAAAQLADKLAEAKIKADKKAADDRRLAELAASI